MAAAAAAIICWDPYGYAATAAASRKYPCAAAAADGAGVRCGRLEKAAAAAAAAAAAESADVW